MFKNLNPSSLGITGHQSEIIELALTFGFKGMDLDIVEFAARAKSKGIEYAKRLIESAGIRVGTFALPLDWESDDETFKKDMEKVAEYASCAATLGCTRAIALLAPAGDERPYHENFEFHRTRFQQICAALQPSGVRLAVGFQGAEYLRENRAFQFIHDLDSLALLVNMVAMPNMGLLVDVWDVYAGGGSLESVRKIPAEQIVAVQLADLPADVTPAELNKNHRLLPGAENGQIDIAGFMAILREGGYDGPLTLKASKEAFGSRRRDMIVKQASEVLTKVMNPPKADDIEKAELTAASE